MMGDMLLPAANLQSMPYDSTMLPLIKYCTGGFFTSSQSVECTPRLTMIA